MSRVIPRESKPDYGPDLIPAHFIEERDRVPMLLCFSTYGSLIQELDGYKLTTVESVFARCWAKGGSVIIGIRGTAVGQPGGFSNLLDDTVIAGLVGHDKCALSIVSIVTVMVQEFIDREFCEIIVCGHSLGGEAAFCIAKKFPQIYSVSFNGAAPMSGGIFEGAGVEKSTAYHIVGDVVSTHISSASCKVFRIKLEPRRVNWGDPFYYHSTSRFYEHGRKYTLWSAQDEQDDMQNYVFTSTAGEEILSLLLGVVTKYLHRDRLREFVCANPIPGSDATNQCLHPPKDSHTFLGAFAGGLIGLVLGGTAGLAALGVTGLVSGAVLGKRLASGQGLLDIRSPIDPRKYKKIKR